MSCNECLNEIKKKYLPIELVEYVFDKVVDKKTILKLRLLNKYFYKKYKTVQDVEEYKMYIFLKNRYEIRNLNNNLKIKEIFFYSPGCYKYVEYSMDDGSIVKEVDSSILKVRRTEHITLFNKRIKDYFVVSDTSKEELRSIGPICSLM